MSVEEKRTSSTAKVAVLSVLLTLAVSGGGAYFLGYLGAPVHSEGNGDAQAGEVELYSCGMHPWILSEEPGLCPICAMELTPKRDLDAGIDPMQSTERKVLYWRAPMDPTEIYEAPGQSKMGMDLVPVYEDEVIGGVEIKIDPVTQQNMGVRTATASRAVLTRTIRTYGHVTYDETRTTQVSPRFSGWIEKLYVDFTGQRIAKDQPLFDINSPELFTAQQEYLVAYKNLKHTDAGEELLASARKRLSWFGVGDREIAALETSGAATRTLTIRSPFAGVVTHKNAETGGFVKSGAPVYRIADLSRVWVEAHIYEYELPWVKVGQEARMELPYQPGKVYTGTVAYVYPYLQQKTRDVVIRLEFDNPGMELKPDMYAEVVVRTGDQGEGTVIPAEAVIRSGERNVVFVTRGDGKFSPREVELGLALDDNRVQVRTGVAPGEEVVVSGQFLLDSESKLKEAVQKMLEARRGGGEAKSAPAEDDFFGDME